VRAEEMLRGYSARWFDEKLTVLAVEAEFDADILNPETGAASRTYRLGGKIDVLVKDAAERVLIVEHKTSSEDVSMGSFYWKRLRLNAQLPTYLVGARALGHDPQEILFDVLGKPGQRPSSTVPVRDEFDMKIVFDAKGERVKVANGKKWRETGDTAAGYVLQVRDETPDEYRARVQETICKDPDKFFVRGTVVRLESEEREAAFDVWMTVANIRESKRLNRHPRNVDSCFKYGAPCPMFEVCTGEASIDDPTRYRRVANPHEELAASKVGLPLVTNSEMGTYRSCARLHHYRYELGVRTVEDGEAQRFGSLIHYGLQGWWEGKRDGLAEGDCLGRAFDMMREPPQRNATAARSQVTL
jgi:hypothetical protein